MQLPGAVAAGRYAVFALRNTPRLSNLRRDFGPRQNAAVAGLGTLAHLDFNQLGASPILFTRNQGPFIPSLFFVLFPFIQQLNFYIMLK